MRFISAALLVLVWTIQAAAATLPGRVLWVTDNFDGGVQRPYVLAQKLWEGYFEVVPHTS